MPDARVNNDGNFEAFEAHQDLLYQVMTRQAGSVSKATLEGIMNSADAGAGRCDVVLSQKCILLNDDGRGFKDMDEIKTNFKILGQPQSAEEKKRKTYGTFRVGRGQMFSFGRNVWRTGMWDLETDISKRMGFIPRNREVPVKGCEITIELYDQFHLLPTALAETARELKLWCRWMMPLEVWLSVEEEEPVLISHDPEEFEWDHVLDEAYVALDDSAKLSVYNMGAHVRDFYKSHFGVGGEVVSRQRFKVNMARNDIQRDCLVWKKVEPVVNQWARTRTIKKKKSWDDSERQSMSRAVKAGEYTWDEVQGMNLFTAVTGRHYKFADVFSCHKHRHKLTVCERGDRLGDRIHREGLAFVLAQETLDRMECQDMESLVDWARLIYPYNLPPLKLVPFESLAQGFKETYELVPEDKRRPAEKIWVELISGCQQRLRLVDETDDDVDFTYRRDNPNKACNRKVVIGLSEKAAGWTDARSYVAIDRKWLGKRTLTVEGFAEVGDLYLHECCHRTPDLETHDHDQGFYELFHDSAGEFLATFISHCFRALPQVLQRHNRRLTRQQLKQQDQAVMAERREEEFNKITKTGPGLTPVPTRKIPR